MSAYKKEAVLTIGFFVAYILMAHTAPWAIVLGVDNSVRVLGFPLHYFLAVVMGWFGVLAVSIAWNHYADKLEEEIIAEDENCTPAHNDKMLFKAPDTPSVLSEKKQGSLREGTQ
ncbi:hypothetical protein [Modicisalibacter luteus]|uniref:DUF3311 domain-containing protein n=1 Tax=Modicisalibacter luteus TaxID=453962 RepID=A0ABV7M598_9GAMM|nr:hypothetical protein [Halomonas lutea]GHA88052.1 hypothetical protein GCM10007159_06820 [Halomonas lutea]